ncbi:MAG: hypothetical protein Kow0029_01430 [Candidatus Rifleibacteriota bacterium]
MKIDFPGQWVIQKHRNGFAIMFALIIGTIMLILAVSLFSFVGQQHTGIQNIVNGEIAHFLAEAGINSCIGTVRQAISHDFENISGSTIKDLLAKPGELADQSITELLGDSWNSELKSFAAEVDKEASIRVEVSLKNFKLTETNVKSWSDPVSKEGYLVIESIGRYKNSERTLSIKRKLKVASILPGPLSKFTLYAVNASRNGESSFNLIRNDYRGTITDGPKPLVCYNHATPDSPFNPGAMSSILKSEKERDVWQKRGWIYLGPRKVRLNLCSGAGELGEIFHFYDVSNSFQFTPVKFVTPYSALPEKLRSTLQLPWDLSSQAVRNVSYSFRHSFVLDGFHDKSSRKDSDAMYEGNILSNGERQQYSSKSSILHLFGDARKGYQSRTRILGPVVAAFPRFSNLEVIPEEPDVKELFANVKPPPLYLIPSRSENDYNNSIEIADILKRKFGGPLLKSGMICNSYSDYNAIMSRITELPYALSYNSMQDVYDNSGNRVFPSTNNILQQDNGNDITISQSSGHVFFKGKISPQSVCGMLSQRVQSEVKEISEFWEKFLDNNGELELNQIVRIRNDKKLDFVVPPPGKALPLVVKGGGMLIVENGNLVFRGVKCASGKEALTIVAPAANSVTFSSIQPNHINLIAPNAELSYSSRLDMAGVLCINSIFADHRFQGGALRFRPEQDPTGSEYMNFYRHYLDETDSYWHE